jgi:ribonuclease D
MKASSSDPAWIATPDALRNLASDLKRQACIAVDTEANSLHAFREQVCLIQLSTAKKDYLLDPLTLQDLSILKPIFSDAKIEKIFHAADYDLMGLKRDFGIIVNSLFDTMQAARMLGYQQVGLEAMLGEKFNVTINKRYQKVDWAHRPLPPEWLDYASQDSHHLIALRDVLKAELLAKGLWDLACEEFVRLSRPNGTTENHTPAWQHVSGWQKMTGQQLAILNELCIWRTTAAQNLNRPVFKTLGDNTLVNLVLTTPGSRRTLESAGLTPRQIDMFGDGLLTAIRQGKTAQPIPKPRPVRPNQAYLNRVDKLRQWRLKVGQARKIESDLILPKSLVQAIAEANPRNLAELRSIMENFPWRFEHFGKEILGLLTTKSSKQG